MNLYPPEPADLIDVRSLNVAFLEYLSGPEGEQLREDLPQPLRPVVAALRERHIERLAEVPFLLLTVRETDDAYWSRALSDSPVRDLFATGRDAADPLARIGSAAVAFLWQLSRRNTYATRLICGASLRWCEQLAACTLLSVLQCAAKHTDLVGPRLADAPAFWQRLLGAGLCSDDNTRRAAHLVSLQAILAPVDASGAARFRAAACYSSVPAFELTARVDTNDDK